MGFVQTGAMVGVGMGVTMVTGGIGVGPYLAGTGAVAGGRWQWILRCGIA